MNYRLEIVRFSENDKQSLSKFVVFDDWNCELGQGYMLELPDKGNKRNISRIPEGKYKCVKRVSEKYGDHFHVKDVPNRTWILIHVGNFNTDTRGCILPGMSLVDINGDGLKDVARSGDTMDMLNELLPDEFDLIVTKVINQFL